MSKILCTINQEKGALNFIAGTVEEIREVDGKRPHVVAMTVNMADADNNMVPTRLELTSWPDSAYNKIENIHRMRLAAGSFILVRAGNAKVTERNGSRTCNMPLFALEFTGVMPIDENNNLYALAGTIKSVTENNDGSALVIIKARYYDRATKEAGDREFPVSVRRSLYNSLKKSGVAQRGTLAVAGTMTGGIVTAECVEYNPPREYKKS